MDIQTAINQVLNESQIEDFCLRVAVETEDQTADVWEQALAALQAEMPRASFETWLRDTKLVSINAGVATVVARNAYARDWLASRMAVVCGRVLSDLTNAPMQIRFVVADETDNSVEEDAEEGELSQEESGTRGFSAEVVDATRYQDEVHPEKVVVLPGYALRLLEHGDLTPKQMSLWLGFRQAVYAQRRRGEGVVRNIPHWEVCRFAMMSRATYFREIRGRSDFAGGLVEKIESGNMGDASRYRVHMTPRLTRRDCAVIERILTAEVAEASTREDGLRRAVDALNHLAERSPADYLEGENATVGRARPRSVNEIVRGVIGLEGDLPGDLADAAERLTDRILRAYGNVVITHHFLTQVVPSLKLSHAQGWAIIMLRDRAWYDYETRTQSDLVIVPGGLTTLAKWAGVSHRRSVEQWMKQPEFCVFVERIPLAQTDLTDEQRREWSRLGTEVFRVRQDDPLAEEREKVRLLARKSETLSAKKCDSEREKVRLSSRKSETLLKASIKPLLNPYKPLELPPPAESARSDKANDRVVVTTPPSRWVLDRILQGRVVSPKLLRQLRGGSGEALVSWLLYALSPEGAGIMRPWNYALDRLAQDPRLGAGGKYDRLASAPPQALIDLAQAAFRSSLTPQDDDPLVVLWFDVMGTGAGDRAVTLLRLLLDSDAPIQIEREFRVDSWRETADGPEHRIEIANELV